jgi:hypothetical protein
LKKQKRKERRAARKAEKAGREIIISPAVEGIRVNDDVFIEGMKEDIGMGVVQGRSRDELHQPIVRFFIANFTKKGEGYLKNKPCLTGKKTVRSRLYIIPERELTVRRDGVKRQNSKTTE